jgi:hypothetical protein
LKEKEGGGGVRNFSLSMPTLWGNRILFKPCSFPKGESKVRRREEF